MLDKTIRKQLGYLLWLERANQEKEIRWVVKKMKTEISSVDFAEHGKGHMNWNFYEEPSSGSWRYLRSLQATLANPTESRLSIRFPPADAGGLRIRCYQRLLDLYGKEVKITLIDKEEKTKTAG